MSNHFYDYALAGIPILMQHNQKITHYGSYYFLEMLLASVKNAANAKKLLFSLKQAGHFEFFEKSINKRLFLKTLNENLVEVYKSDITIIYPLLALIKRVGRDFNKSEYEELSDFFNKTNSNTLALKILFNDIKNLSFWNFSYLLNEGCFDFLLNEFEEGNISTDTLWSIYSATNNYGDKDVAKKLMLKCEDATENNFLPKRSLVHDDYEIYEKLKEKNDLRFILDKGAFKKGLINYFGAFKSEIISKDELYIDHYASLIKKKANSLSIYHFLKEYQPWNTVEKGLALRDLEKMDFEWFQVLEILRKHNKESILANSSLLEIIENYYYKKLPECKFESTYFSKTNGSGKIESWHRPLEIKIAEIFVKFEFDTNEEILIKMLNADNGGIKNFEHHSINNVISLSETILSKISEKNLSVLKQSIINNMQLGILDMGVLENHIGLCRHLKIYNSTSIIYNILTNLFSEGKHTSYGVNDIVDIYLELGGEMSNLVPLIKQIKNYNEYCLIHLAKKLEALFSHEIIPILIKALFENDTKEDRKFEIAHILIDIGKTEGLNFIVSHLEVHKFVSNRNLRDISFLKLDTKEVLNQIDDICYLIVDDNQKEIHWTESGQGIIRNWILSLAEKSEEDLILVNDFLIKKSVQLNSKYERHFDLHWYRLLALEKFRDLNTNSFDIPEISELVN